METATVEPKKFEIVSAPETAEMEAEIRPVLDRALTVKIENQAGLDATAADLAKIREFRRRWKALWYDGPNGEKDRGPYALMRDAGKAMLAIFNRGDDRPEKAEAALKAEQGRYLMAEQKRREEEAARQQREAEAAERKRREEEAAEIRKQQAEEEARRKKEFEAEQKRLALAGENKRALEAAKRKADEEAAKRKRETEAEIAEMKAAPVAVAAPPAAPVKAKGLGLGTVWKAVSVDAAVVDRKWLGPPEVSRIERAKNNDPTLVVKGVVFQKVPAVSGRG